MSWPQPGWADVAEREGLVGVLGAEAGEGLDEEERQRGACPGAAAAHAVAPCEGGEAGAVEGAEVDEVAADAVGQALLVDGAELGGGVAHRLDGGPVAVALVEAEVTEGGYVGEGGGERGPWWLRGGGSGR